MLLIQILLVIAVAALTLYFLSNRRKARAKAGVKIGFMVFLILAIFAVLFPDATTWIAQLVGVQRGTDLMLYGFRVGHDQLVFAFPRAGIALCPLGACGGAE